MIAEELRLVIAVQVGNAIANLQKTTEAVQKATKAAKQSTSYFAELKTELLKGITSLATGVGTVMAMKKAFDFLVGSVKLAIEEEESLNRLNAAIQSVGKQGQISAKRLRTFAESLAENTRYEHETTEAAAILLIQIGNLDQEGIQKIMPHIMDMAAALDMDLNQAATMVAKTLGSDMNALSRWGLELDKTQSPTERLARTTDFLTQKFSGMAVAAGATTLGKLKALQSQFQELRAEMTESSLPAISAIAEKLTDIMKATRAGHTMKTLLSPEGFVEAISNLENARAAIKQLEDSIKVFEKLRKQGDPGAMFSGPFVAKMKEYLGMLYEVIPLLTIQEAAMTKVVVAAKYQYDTMDMVDRILFNHIPKIAKCITLQDRFNVELLKGVEYGTYLGSTYEQLIDLTDKYNAELLKGVDYTGKYITPLKEINEELEKQRQRMLEVINAFAPMAEAFGTMIVNAEDGWEAFRDAAKSAIASVIKMLAQQAFVQAAAAFVALNIPLGIAWTAAGMAAMVAAGVVEAMAQGGIVTGPTHALIGEAGPEAVIPLNKMGGMGGVTIIINGSVMEEEGLARKIGGIIGRQRRGY